MGYKLQAACFSHMGLRRRNNEDNFLFNGSYLPEVHSGTERTLTSGCLTARNVHLAVFDGIGGENYGEQASYAAARKHFGFIGTAKPFYISDKKYLENLTITLNEAVVEKAKELVTSRMGTTFAMMYFTSRYGYAVNLGDSRIFLMRGDSLQQLSVDDVSACSVGTAKKAPITQYLGMDPSEVTLVPHINRIVPQKGDRYVICTDGLTDMVMQEDIKEMLRENGDAKKTVEKLMDRALAHGGRDNVTVIVCDIC